MDESNTSGERTVPVALRFEASPGLRHSFNELIIPQRRQLGDVALYLYVAGNDDLPVAPRRTGGVDGIVSAKEAINHYNYLLSRPVKGVDLYHRQFPVASIDHFLSEDGLWVDFTVHVRTTSLEMNQLRQQPFDVNIGTELTLPYHQLQVDMCPLPERSAAYTALRRALGSGSLYATHPVAVILSPQVN